MFSLHYIMAACKIMVTVMLLVWLCVMVNGDTFTNGSTQPFQNVSVTTSMTEGQSETSAATVITKETTPTSARWGGHLFQRCCKMFSKSSQAVGLNCSCHAAQASKGNFQKICYETFGMSGRPTQHSPGCPGCE